MVTIENDIVSDAKPSKASHKAAKAGSPKEIDVQAAASNVRLAMKQIAAEMAQLDEKTRIKKANYIKWMGYEVVTEGDTVTVKFVAEKSKKAVPVAQKAAESKKENAKKEKKNAQAAKPAAAKKQRTPSKKPIDKPADDVFADALGMNDDEPKVEVVPAGDLYGTNGIVDDDAFIDDPDDDDFIDPENEDDENYNDEYDDGPVSTDYRDEQDQGLVEARREFFGGYGDDFEPNDD